MTTPVQTRMKFRVVTMTPTWAKELLQHNHPRNRKRKWSKINAYARDMKQGFWRLTHQPIAVDVDGNLIDGQNRLEAVVLSECDVPFVLCTECERESILGADLGASRNVLDMAQIGGTPFKSTDRPAVVRKMMTGLKNTPWPTNAEVMDFAAEHRQALEFAFECLPTNVKGITQAAVRAVVARAYYKLNKRNRTRTFCEVLASGMPNDSEKDSAALRLRNWLQDNFLGGKKGLGKRVRPEIVYAYAERALQAFHNEEYQTRVEKVDRELFPIPDDPTLEEEEVLNGQP